MASITLGGNPISTIGDLPQVGSVAPMFDGVKKDLALFNSGDLIGKNIIINIFASIDTGICADSTRRFNKEAAMLDNTAVVCISKDLPFALGRICDAEELNNVIPVSAFNSSFGTDYGVTILDGPMKGLLSRSVVVIDTEGKVIYTEQVPEIAQEPNYNSAIAALK